MKYEYLKGSEKDFEGAPESAMVRITEISFDNEGAIFADKFENGSKRNHYATGAYDSYIADVSNWTIIAERRPITEQVWDGEGLMPSVGMKCLAKQCSQINADEFLVVAIQDGAVFGFWTATGAATGLDVNRWIFLPIRSPEDVARDEVGLAIYHAINWNSEGELVNPSRMEDYKKAYDAIAAGKIPGVKLEGK